MQLAPSKFLSDNDLEAFADFSNKFATAPSVVTGAFRSVLLLRVGANLVLEVFVDS